MTLYPIHAMGIQAYCSDLIVDSSDSETVYFMSVAGYQATVKGIIANLLDNYGISILTTVQLIIVTGFSDCDTFPFEECFCFIATSVPKIRYSHNFEIKFFALT